MPPQSPPAPLELDAVALPADPPEPLEFDPLEPAVEALELDAVALPADPLELDAEPPVGAPPVVAPGPLLVTRLPVALVDAVPPAPVAPTAPWSTVTFEPQAPAAIPVAATKTSFHFIILMG